MRKYTQKEIKDLVRDGYAINITTAQEEEIKEPLEKVGYSLGVYGLNGGVLIGRETGKLYAITARSTNLFRWF